ncbi:MAG: small multi-drug export protein [bacterium]
MISPILKVFLSAMLPVAELRVSIPLGIDVFGLSWQKVLLWSVVGNLIPAVILLLFLDPVSHFLMKRFRIFDKFFSWLFARTRRKHSEMVDIWGALALMIFVAVPLPGTGAWTGAAVAFVFGIDFKKAFFAIAMGVLAAGIIMTVLSLGIAVVF